MLLQFMARTGASRKREGEHRQPDARVIHRTVCPARTDSKSLQPRKAENQISNTLPAGGRPRGAPRKRETRGNGEPLARASSQRRSTQPLVLDQKIRTRTRSGWNRTRLPSIFLKAGRLSATQFTNRRSRTLFTSPSIKNIATIFDPPELISGSGMPVTGIRPTTIPTFTST